MSIFAVITADVIDSKLYPEAIRTLRAKVQQLILPGLHVSFTVSRGDELQGVVNDFNQIPLILRHLRFRCRPLKLRVGIGIGTVEPWETSVTSWDMDGSAFRLARDAEESIKNVKAPKTIISSNNSSVDHIVNTIYNLTDLIVSQWTEEQWQAIFAYESCGTFEKAGEVLKISLQNVHKRCQAAHWSEVQSTENSLGKIFAQHFQAEGK